MGYTQKKTDFFEQWMRLEGFIPLQTYYNEESYLVLEPEVWRPKVQTVFGTNDIGPSQNMRNSFVLVQSGDEEKKSVGDKGLSVFTDASERIRRGS